MALPYNFTTQTGVTFAQLMANFAALGALTPIPCAVFGTNALTLTPAANTPTVAALSNYMQFTGIAANTSNGAVSAAVAGLAPLNVYKDSSAGPIALVGGEIVANCAFILVYDAALGSGAGGFHLISGGAVLIGQTVTVGALIVGSTLTPATLSRVFSRASTIGFTVVPANTGQSLTFTLAGAAIGDMVLVQPPTLTAGLLYNGVVSVNGTITLQAINATAASLTPPGGTYRVLAMGYS